MTANSLSSSSKTISNNFSICSFNVWCPHWNGNESQSSKIWKKRHKNILNILLSKSSKNANKSDSAPSAINSDIFCLQEFWCPSNKHPFVLMYRQHFSHFNYELFYLKRASSRKPDGIAIAFNKEMFELIEEQSLKTTVSNPLLHSYDTHFSNRVAIFAHLRHKQSGCTIAVSTSHLTFPSDPEDQEIRHRQCSEWLKVMNQFMQNSKHTTNASIMCGDYNCEIDGNEALLCINNGYKSTFHECNGNSISSFISHINHNGKSSGCDFIFFKNESGINCKTSEVNDENKNETDILSKSRIIPVTSYLYPRIIGIDVWPKKSEWNLSDHRPIISLFDIHVEDNKIETNLNSKLSNLNISQP